MRANKKIIIYFLLTLILSTPAAAEIKYVDSANGLRLREACSTGSEVLTVMPYRGLVDEIATIMIKEVEWSKVTYECQTGYCRTEYLTDQDPLDGATYMGTWRITAYAYTGSACANGHYPETGYTIACNSLPFGTEVYIDGVGFRTVEDRGPSWLGDQWCDLYLGDTAECVAWGDQYREVWVIE